MYLIKNENFSLNIRSFLDFTSKKDFDINLMFGLRFSSFYNSHELHIHLIFIEIEFWRYQE